MTSWRLRGPADAGPRRRLNSVLLAAVLAGLGAVALLRADLARILVGPGAADRAGVDGRQKGGSLVIGGGGRLPEEVLDRFAELAGGPRAQIVVIPTAHPEAYALDPGRFLKPWRDRGVASARVLHAEDRPMADDPAFARQLAGSTGVWFSGGLQSRLAATYAGTRVERELRALLARGGVVGGTSAGAAALTRVAILGGRAGGVFEGHGLDLLPGAVVDQHFLRRNRLGRLLGVLATHPGLVGFGIDEGTALVVRLSDLQLEVVGDSYVVACLPAPAGGPARVEFLKRGDRTNLGPLKVSPAAITHTPDLDALLTAAPGG